jgi:hypothetical protein
VGVSSGNVSGRGGSGVVLDFALANPQGSIIFGVVALEANLI